jgi:hypothetical protein
VILIIGIVRDTVPDLAQRPLVGLSRVQSAGDAKAV